MPVTLLDSQLEALEPLEADEHGIAVDAAEPPAAIVRAVLEQLPVPR
jgi:gluconate kinase